MLKILLIGEQPDAERRSCVDCHHCQAAISWWCVNKKALDSGYSLYTEGCPYWCPCDTIEDVGSLDLYSEEYIVFDMRPLPLIKEEAEKHAEFLEVFLVTLFLSFSFFLFFVFLSCL